MPALSNDVSAAVDQQNCRTVTVGEHCEGKRHEKHNCVDYKL